MVDIVDRGTSFQFEHDNFETKSWKDTVPPTKKENFSLKNK